MFNSLFGHSQTKRWHRHIDDLLPAEWNWKLLEDVDPKEKPWCQMRRATDRYLARKTRSKGAENKDELLKKLVLVHFPKEVAILACGHAFSASALRHLLFSDSIGSTDSLDSVRVFLRRLYAASLVSEAISQEECREALILLKRTNLASSAHLAGLVETLSEPSKESLLYLHIYTVPMQLADLCSVLDTLKKNRDWYLAHTKVGWLSKFEKLLENSSPQHHRLKALLDQHFPSWRAWAFWQPNMSRIKTWAKLNRNVRGKFYDIIDLDGPDFELYGKTLGQSLPGHKLPEHSRANLAIQFDGSTHEECLHMAERLLRLAEKALTYQFYDTQLFICMTKYPKILKRKLDLLEVLARREFTSIRRRIAEAFSIKDITFERKNDAVKWLLKHLNNPDYKHIREAIAIDFAPLVQAMVSEERNRFLRFVVGPLGRATVIMTSEEQRDLRSDLLQASWLLPFYGRSSVSGTIFSSKDLTTLRAIYLNQESLPTRIQSASITNKIRSYILEDTETSDPHSKDSMKALISVWRTSQDSFRRCTAIALVLEAGIYRSLCIRQLPLLSDSFVQSLWHIGNDAVSNPELASVAFTHLIASASLGVDMYNWIPLLYESIMKQGEKRILKYAMEKWTIHGWINFLENLHRLFGKNSPGEAFYSLTLVTHDFLGWAKQLVTYSSVIMELQQKPDPSGSLGCLYSTAVDDVHVQQAVQAILQSLGRNPKNDWYGFTVQVSMLNRLAEDGNNATEVRNAIAGLSNLSSAGIEVCIRIQGLLNTELSKAGLRVYLEAWLSDPSISEQDTQILRTVFVDNTSDGPQNPWLADEALVSAANHLDAEYAELLKEARRLAALRVTLRSVDLEGVTELLADIGIEDSSDIEDTLASLPPEILNAVEIVGEKEVQIMFPLTHLTPLRRTALGLGSEQNFVLLLELCDHRTFLNRFCIHFETGSKHGTLDDIETIVSPWSKTCRLGGDSSLCSPSRHFFQYVLTKMLQRCFPKDNLARDFTSLSEIHTLITTYLKSIGKHCIECGRTFTTSLHRPTTCNSPICISKFSLTPPEIQFSHPLQDNLTTSLLLSSISSAAQTKNLLLLPNCAIPIDEIPTLISQHLSTNMKNSSTPLLTYALTTPRFNVIHAPSSPLKIPSLPPGTLQFLLTNHSPEIENRFSYSLTSSPATQTKIMFHGTTPDRLFAILSQGLKILSGTDLQVNGAVSGSGVYLSDDPAVAFGYCTRALKFLEVNGDGEEKEYKVLLGVEYVGEGEGESICVVRDEGRVAVRFVFLIPVAEAGRTVLVRNHLVSGMGSVCGGLRSGAL